MINNDVPIAFFISKLRSITKAGTIKNHHQHQSFL
jgi:hypothetical protein